QVGFMHQSGRVERVAVLVAELAAGHAVQFAVERGQHAIERLAIPVAGGTQPLRDLGRVAHLYPGPLRAGLGATITPRASALAVAAPDAGAVAQGGIAQRASATAAGFALAAVNLQLLLEIAGRAVGVDEVAQGGAAAIDRVEEDALDGFGQPAVAFARNAPGGARRGDAGG